MNKREKIDYFTIIFLKVRWSLVIILLIIVGLVKFLFQDKVDPMDAGLITKSEVIGLAEVRDSSYCGFDVVYATRKNVTAPRAEEIRSRPHIKENIKRLEKEAPLYFGNMLYTDIYEFAEFAKKYELDQDVQIQNIWIAGTKKCRLYIGDNPKIVNSARWYNPNTRQGALFITKIDVYKRYEKSRRIYRYWKCSGLNETSTIDEHFSHFSENERID
ncbi:hypothetical protein [Dysgonomonas sp. 511]|uniref:hypothetical protein n=1 Tax=Dysgonomonas sp. 511 TaxID=2302930 RepID=UPI0013D27F62|nr:hypothetical protein [Dysgonomonas sp. 511]NDV80290.1 hypothetical protein [Dysgonomonas sp. 511]